MNQKGEQRSWSASVDGSQIGCGAVRCGDNGGREYVEVEISATIGTIVAERADDKVPIFRSM